ncbi:Leucine-rich repeat [Lasallia pustulata]|uniref:Leucine-rich repeat n=1 Tax=Lasallia pustulata TaxID=136370 RepID=A0A1W5CY90_9LECA|nr:Leucine-rich repeat [Lasallia pustulata]
MATRTRPSRSSRAARSRVSYREWSSDDSAGDSPDGPYINSSRASRSRQAPSPPRIRAHARPSDRKRRAPPLRSSRPLKQPRKLKQLTTGHTSGQLRMGEAEVPGTSQLGGRIPPWQTLPYHLLLQIFQYASYPLVDDRFEPTSSVSWLLNSAMICKAFNEPALSTLYYAPPLSPPSRVHGLIAHLVNQGSSSTYNYKGKIRYLDMEATSTLVRKYGGRDPVDLSHLLVHTPQLQGLGIHLVSDQPRYRKRDLARNLKVKAVYQKTIFSALITGNVTLRSWKWNSRLTGSRYSLSDIKEIHCSTPFQSLHTLTLVKFQTFETDSASSKDNEEKLAAAINSLPNLKRLSFQVSSVVNEKLLPLLPENLESFQIIDCSSVTSDILDVFLVTHGRNLRELVLDHNKLLNLSFLVDLAASCPKLEVLKMNMTYYNSHFTFQDSEPQYDTLLLPGEEPTWPASLQVLELLQLRKLHADSAKEFFGSLINSAPSLPNLRKLVIKASLDSLELGWRDRASFRDEWIGKLRQVFLRHSTPPDTHLHSIEAFTEYKCQLGDDQSASQVKTGNARSNLPRSARPGVRRSRSSRFSDVEVLNNLIDSESDSDVTHIPRRRSSRLKQQDDEVYDAPKSPASKASSDRLRRRLKPSDVSGSPEESDTSASSIDAVLPEEEPFIQGLCEAVDIRIDNQRPTEEQFHENDFLDEEPIGDEDWNGDDTLPGDRGHAW